MVRSDQPRNAARTSREGEGREMGRRAVLSPRSGQRAGAKSDQGAFGRLGQGSVGTSANHGVIAFVYPHMHQRSSYRLPCLSRPLRPLWITPSTSVFPALRPLDELKYSPIICVSASKQVGEGLERRSHGFSYVQGSGDDHELWGMVCLFAMSRHGLPHVLSP